MEPRATAEKCGCVSAYILAPQTHKLVSVGGTDNTPELLVSSCWLVVSSWSQWKACNRNELTVNQKVNWIDCSGGLAMS